MRVIVLAACLALAPSIARAQWSQNGQPTPDATDRKSSEGFGAHLVVISHFPEFIKEWTETPPEHTPKVPAVTKAKRGERLAIILFFGGCKAGASGTCNALYDLTIVRPDGSTMNNFTDLELWKKEAPPNVQLSAAIPQVQFEHNEPVGMYRIRVVARDENRKVTLQLETTLEVK
jgi:hypothetical protein